MDWELPPELQKKFDEVVANNARLQATLGIKSRTIEERAADHAKKKAAQSNINQLLGNRRPPPKWKI